MKKKFDFCLMVLLTLTAFLISMNGVRRRDEALAARIAPDILRFHVLANSDSPKDQALKLAVKDYLLDTIHSNLSISITKDMLEQYLLDNESALELQAEEFIQEQGFDYPADIRLETCEFPQRTYGDMTFPAGTYDAVRVLIGDGAGENFWCVLYPSLCYLDSTHAVVPEASKDVLRTLLPEADFQALLTARRTVRFPGNSADHSPSLHQQKTGQDPLLPRLTIRFKLFE